MKKAFAISIIVFSVIMSVPAYAKVTGNVDLLPGVKFLNGGASAWDDVNVQTYGLLPGIELNARDESWPVNINFTYIYASMSTWMNFVTAPLGVVTWEYGETQEFDLGVRKIWETAPHVRPYIGVGGTYIYGYMQKTFNLAWFNYDMDLSDSSGGWGGYVEAGIYWEIVKHFNLGLGAAYSIANLKFDGTVIDGNPESTRGSVTVNGGGFRANAIVGYHF